MKPTIKLSVLFFVAVLLSLSATAQFTPIDKPWTKQLTNEDQARLIFAEDLEYKGAFRIPRRQQADPNLAKAFNAHGHGWAFRADGDSSGPNDDYPGSLYGVGHPKGDHPVAEITIPEPIVSTDLNDLNVAEYLSGFVDITDGLRAEKVVEWGRAEVTGVYFLKGENGATDKLVWNVRDWYGTNGNNPSTLGWSNADFTNLNRQGLWRVGPSDDGAYHQFKSTGYFVEIPEAWANEHTPGKKVGSGFQRSSGSWGSSAGPALFATGIVNDRASYPDGHQFPSTPLLYYATRGSDDFRNGITQTIPDYQPCDRSLGAAWVTDGSRSSVVFTYRKSLGEWYYGPGNDNGRTVDCTDAKGYHCGPYAWWLLFYDPADFERQIAGEINPWEIMPYEIVQVDIGYPSCDMFTNGVAYDRGTNNIYISQRNVDDSRGRYDDLPAIHTFTVGDGPNCIENGCPSDTQCSTYTCNPTTLRCEANPINEGDLCTQDNLFCNGEERCSQGTCASTNPPCPESDYSCIESCNEATNTCGVPNNAACNDFRSCTTDLCVGVGGDANGCSNDDSQCVAVEQPTCDPLPPPEQGANIITVSPDDIPNLQDIVRDAPADSTIYFEDGNYIINRYLIPSNPGITFRSLSGDRNAVIIDGNYDRNSAVPFFIQVPDITIADITIKHAHFHNIQVTGDGDNFLLHNVNIIDARQQFVKINEDDGAFPDNGVIQCSSFELTNSGREYIEANPTGNFDCYTGGIDAHSVENWVVKDNYFRGIYCSEGSPAEHAIHFWKTAKDITVERNQIYNCARGIGFGLGQTGGHRTYPGVTLANPDNTGHIGGVIKNNVVFANTPRFDTGIGIEAGIGVSVLHNTVFASQGFSGIDLRYEVTDALVEYNLYTQQISQRNNANPTARNNMQANANFFVDTIGENLRLAYDALPINQGQPGDVQVDADGNLRDDRPDTGAYEYSVSNCAAYDNNCDGEIQIAEVLDIITMWKDNQVSITQVLSVITEWKNA